MPLFLIERNFAEDLLLDEASVGHVKLINDEIGVQWLYSFLSDDKRKTYCLYEAPSADAIRAAAAAGGPSGGHHRRGQSGAAGAVHARRP